MITDIYSEKFDCIKKEHKMALIDKRLSLEFEEKCIKEAKKSLKHGTLNFFIAKRLDKIVERIDRTERRIIEAQNLMHENDFEIQKRLLRLRTI